MSELLNDLRHRMALIRTVMLLCIIAIVGGCAPADASKRSTAAPSESAATDFPKNKYAAEFRAINLCDHAIVMNRCDGFETWASPEAGVLIPNAESGSSFPPVSEFPSKTTIHWHDEQDGKDYEQTVELAEVVPRGVEGVTVFQFGKDQKWIVRFEPGPQD